MFWEDFIQVMAIAALGGIVGGFVMGIALWHANKFNMEMMEAYWIDDILRVDKRIDRLSLQLSTNSGDKVVSNNWKAINDQEIHARPRFDQKG